MIIIDSWIKLSLWKSGLCLLYCAHYDTNSNNFILLSIRNCFRLGQIKLNQSQVKSNDSFGERRNLLEQSRESTNSTHICSPGQNQTQATLVEGKCSEYHSTGCSLKLIDNSWRENKGNHYRELLMLSEAMTLVEVFHQISSEKLVKIKTGLCLVS